MTSRTRRAVLPLAIALLATSLLGGPCNPTDSVVTLESLDAQVDALRDRVCARYAERRRTSPDCDIHRLRIQELSVTIAGLLGFDSRGIVEDAVGVGSLTAPTLRVRSGSTAYVEVINALDRAGTQAACPFHANSFHCADTTALYVQGLPFGPTGGALDPGFSKLFALPVAEEFPKGLHLYRAGHHGSSALQSAGGFAGVIEVINDDVALPADLAALYDSPAVPPLLLQHLFFGASDGGAGAFALASHPSISAAYGSEQTIALNASAAPTTVVVNGEYQPSVPIFVGDATLLRFVSSSTTRTIELELDDPASRCEMQLLARDGIFQRAPFLTIESIVLLPGTRADVAVLCTSVGSYGVDANPNPANPLSGSNRHTQTDVMRLDVVSLPVGATPRPLPTSSPPLPASLDSLLTEVAVPPLNEAGAQVTNIAMGPGSTVGEFGVNGVSFQGHDAPAATKYLFKACVGEVYEMTLGNGALGTKHPVSFSGFHVEMQAGDAGGGVMHRLGEWRDVVLANGSTVRFRPQRAGDYEIGCSILQHRDRGELALIEVGECP